MKDTKPQDIKDLRMLLAIAGETSQRCKHCQRLTLNGLNCVHCKKDPS